MHARWIKSLYLPAFTLLNLMALLAALTLVLLAGCTRKAAETAKPAATPASEDLAVSGKLNLSKSKSPKKKGRKPASTDITTYSVVCTTATTPPKKAVAKLNANGSFNLELKGGRNQPMSCYVIDGDGTKVADVLIADSANKDLNGNSSVSNTATFSDAIDFGSAKLDVNSGEVTVPKTQLSRSLVEHRQSPSAIFDPTGLWKITDVDFTLPNGVRSTCTETESDEGKCNGPPKDYPLYFKMWNGVKADSSVQQILQLWANDHGNDPSTTFATCGSRIGLTADKKTELGLDFSAYGAADDVFVIATSLTDFDDKASGNQHENVPHLLDGWKMVEVAKSDWNMQTGCSSKRVTVGGVDYNGWMCGPDGDNHYQLGISGGCVDAQNKPVNTPSWDNITVNADGTGGRANSTNTTDANLIQSNSMTGYYNGSLTKAGTLVTCTSSWMVTDVNGIALGTQQQPGSFNWNTFQASQTNYPAGTFCKDMVTATDAQKIMQLQCYENYYRSSGLGNASGICVPRVRSDWSQTDPAKFVKVDLRPSGLVFMDQYRPFADGSGGAMLTRQEEYNGVQVNGSWVPCHTIETGGITLKKISATKLFATYQASTVTVDRDVPACVAKFNGKKETFWFYLVK